jgi:small-conductance mechanosensitive channel
MTTESFQKNSIGWQIQQWQQQVGEEWELQTKRWISNSDFSLPSFDWINFPLLWEITKVVLIILVLVFLIWAAWQIWQLLSPSWYRLANPTNKINERPEKNLSIADLLKRSQQLKQKGDYYKAFQCLYLAMLQQLSDHHIAPSQASYTDGEYLQIIQRLPRPQPYQFLLTIHQQLCFSNRQASLDLLEECQQAYQEMELDFRS